MRVIHSLSIDVISAMDDRELDSRFRDVTRAIRKVKDNSQKIQLEEEYCYLFREKEIRHNRIMMHQEYLATTNHQS